MKLPLPIAEGQLVKRYKRFFADVKLDDEVVTAHVPNTGSLKSCLNENALCRMSYHDNPKRKLKYTLQMIKTPTSWVGVNTSLPNVLVWEAWERKDLWPKLPFAKREVKISKETRLDMALWQKDYGLGPKKKIDLENFDKYKFHFVEIKNVTFRDGEKALFPDSVTTRGQKHLRELMELKRQGHKSEIFFVVQRTDCQIFSPADDIDPEYGRLLRQAKKEGVTISAYACKMLKDKISLDCNAPLKIIL